MSWRTVYITQREKISLYLDNLLIIKDSIEYKIPLKDIGISYNLDITYDESCVFWNYIKKNF